MLAVGAKVSVAAADPHPGNRRLASRTGLARPLKNVAPMLRLPLAPKQVALRAAPFDPFGQHLLNRGVQAADFFREQ
jgi:hypothetical protein